MYHCGDLVVYGIHGTCRITAVEKRKIDRSWIEYFVLKPIDNPNANFYVPTGNPIALSKLRPILTYDALHDLLRKHKSTPSQWTNDENLRKAQYMELITSSDPNRLLGAVIQLYKQREIYQNSGRRFHMIDENFLNDAKKLLDSEFSVVLNIPRCDVESYVQNILNS